MKPYLHIALVASKKPHLTREAGLKARLLLLLALLVPQLAVALSNDVHQEIQRIESQAGAYSPKLSEHLVTLAALYQSKGKHLDAIDIYKRAIHVQRINEGLYNLNQAPVIERLIESQIALGDWEEAAKKHEHLFWLHQQNYGDSDPQLLPVLSKMSKWHLNAYSVSPVEPAKHLSTAYRMFNQSIEIIEEHYGSYDIRLIEPLQGLAISYYFWARWRAKQENRRPTKSSVHEASISFTNNKFTEAERKAKVDRYMLNSYHNGKRSIARMREIFEADKDSDPVNAIKAQVQLGDWYMLFDRPNSAHREYQEAYQAIGEHEHLVDFRSHMFAKPRALPDLPLIEAETGDSNAPQDYVVVKFDVTARGDARNIEFLDSKPKDKIRNRVTVRRNLKVAKFRPKYDNGEPVNTAGIVHRYFIPK